jgi:hypothetical protein
VIRALIQSTASSANQNENSPLTSENFGTHYTRRDTPAFSTSVNILSVRTEPRKEETEISKQPIWPGSAFSEAEAGVVVGVREPGSMKFFFSDKQEKLGGVYIVDD